MRCDSRLYYHAPFQCRKSDHYLAERVHTRSMVGYLQPFFGIASCNPDQASYIWVMEIILAAILISILARGLVNVIFRHFVYIVAVLIILMLIGRYGS